MLCVSATWKNSSKTAQKQSVWRDVRTDDTAREGRLPEKPPLDAHFDEGHVSVTNNAKRETLAHRGRDGFPTATARLRLPY